MARRIASARIGPPRFASLAGGRRRGRSWTTRRRTPLEPADLKPDQPLTPQARLDEALRRLSVALDQLETATQRRAALDAQRADLVEEAALLEDDRARLAADLDAASARERALEATQAQIAQRLARAGEAIRAVIDASERS